MSTEEEKKDDGNPSSPLKKVHPFLIMCALLALSFYLLPHSINVGTVAMRGSTTSDNSIDVVPYVESHIGAANGEVATRPTMYTFFARIHPNNKVTGMKDEDDTALLKAWTEKWNDAGWNTEILTLKHAKKHPRYEEFLKKLQQVPLNQRNRVYNEICYLRWLAIAAVGGGWMSDYDIFPLGTGSGSSEIQAAELPNDGEFTVYSIIPGSRGAGIPCLMSGNSDEWIRLAFQVLNNAMEKSGKEPHWTDMFALMDLRWSGEVFKYGDQVVDGDHMLLGRDWKKDDCKLTEGKRAIHFSHSAMNNGNMASIKGATNNVADRPLVLNHWINMWTKVCKSA